METERGGRPSAMIDDVDNASRPETVGLHGMPYDVFCDVNCDVLQMTRD